MAEQRNFNCPVTDQPCQSDRCKRGHCVDDETRMTAAEAVKKYISDHEFDGEPGDAIGIRSPTISN